MNWKNYLVYGFILAFAMALPGWMLEAEAWIHVDNFNDNSMDSGFWQFNQSYKNADVTTSNANEINGWLQCYIDEGGGAKGNASNGFVTFTFNMSEGFNITVDILQPSPRNDGGVLIMDSTPDNLSMVQVQPESWQMVRHSYPAAVDFRRRVSVNRTNATSGWTNVVKQKGFVDNGTIMVYLDPNGTLALTFKNSTGAYTMAKDSEPTISNGTLRIGLYQFTDTSSVSGEYCYLDNFRVEVFQPGTLNTLVSAPGTVYRGNAVTLTPSGWFAPVDGTDKKFTATVVHKSTNTVMEVVDVTGGKSLTTNATWPYGAYNVSWYMSDNNGNGTTTSTLWEVDEFTVSAIPPSQNEQDVNVAGNLLMIALVAGVVGHLFSKFSGFGETLTVVVFVIILAIGSIIMLSYI